MARRPWFGDPLELERVIADAVEFQPGLKIVTEGDKVAVSGSYQIVERGRLLDHFELRVLLPADSARGLPTVEEVGGRIPRVQDRHVSADGTLCVCLPDAYWYFHPAGMTLREFLAGPLRSHLASQALIDMGQADPWAIGEWSHGSTGVVEFYSGILRARDVSTLARLLRIASRSKVGGVGRCPCESGRRFSACHALVVFKLRQRLSGKQLKSALRSVLDELIESGAVPKGA